MLRVPDDLAGRALLDDPAEVHDRDPVGEVRRRREVVRDHQDREPALPQPVEQLQDAGADRDVEHRDRLVGDEQPRLEHERRRDRDPLALPAGELVRVPVEEELRRRQLDPRERLAHPVGALRFEPPSRWIEQRLLDRVPHPEPRVERLVRILVDHLHPAPQRPQRARAERR